MKAPCEGNTWSITCALFVFIDLSSLAALGIIVPGNTPVIQREPIADRSVATRTDKAVTATTGDRTHAPQTDLQGTIVPRTEVKHAN